VAAEANLGRIQLGTPYTQIVDRLVKVVGRLRKRLCRLVVDMLRADDYERDRAALPGRGVVRAEGDLLAGLQAALETGDLRIARRRGQTAALIQELWIYGCGCGEAEGCGWERTGLGAGRRGRGRLGI